MDFSKNLQRTYNHKTVITTVICRVFAQNDCQEGNRKLHRLIPWIRYESVTNQLQSKIVKEEEKDYTYHRDLRSFKIWFESDIPIRFESDGVIQKFRIGHTCRRHTGTTNHLTVQQQNFNRCNWDLCLRVARAYTLARAVGAIAQYCLRKQANPHISVVVHLYGTTFNLSAVFLSQFCLTVAWSYPVENGSISHRFLMYGSPRIPISGEVLLRNSKQVAPCKPIKWKWQHFGYEKLPVYRRCVTAPLVTIATAAAQKGSILRHQTSGILV